MILRCVGLWICWSLALGGAAATLHAQTTDGSSQVAIELDIDNDSFTIPQIDDYYTSGIYLGMRRALPDSSAIVRWFQTSNQSLRRAAFRLGFGHRFYTPKDYDDANPIEFDRPYAGWLFLSGGLDLFYGRRHWWQIHADLGVVGPMAKAGEIQTLWHRMLSYDLPQGWKYQINNTPAINLRLSHTMAVIDQRWGQLLTENRIEAGTIRNYARLGGGIRLGKLNPLARSQYSRAKFWANDGREWYLVAGLQYEYVFYNSLIEGNFIGPPSPHTEIADTWVRHERFGFGFSRDHFDFEMLLNRLSQEVIGGRRHRYLSMQLAWRF
jgi:lipid A 3-O-deacylase